MIIPFTTILTFASLYLPQPILPLFAAEFGVADTDAALLARAREALAGANGGFILERRDVIAQPPNSGQYDLVALFGVLHHVPGAETRRALLRSLAERVAPGGLLAFACWRFMDYRRFRDRICWARRESP